MRPLLPLHGVRLSLVLLLCPLLGCSAGDVRRAGPDAGPDAATGFDLSTPRDTRAADTSPRGLDLRARRCPEGLEKHTVGLTYCTEDTTEGYTLFSPVLSTEVFLVDSAGQLVHSWELSAEPALSAYLAADGTLVRPTVLPGPNPFAAGGSGGRVEKVSWEGDLLWSYDYAADGYWQHHDVVPMPSGTVLILAWEKKTRAEAMAAGRRPEQLVGDELWLPHLVEVQPLGSSDGLIVWRWHLWDHLVQQADPTRDNYGVVAEQPGLLDINYTPETADDWIHANSVDYDPARDQVLLSAHTMGEVWIIDHSTTTAEAAGHSGGRHGRGGDLLYRWGNPAAYKTDPLAGQKVTSRQLFGQHNATFIPLGHPGGGNIMVFDNGLGRPDGIYSRVVELVLPTLGPTGYALQPGQPFGPPGPVWSYSGDPAGTLLSLVISSAGRLASGNTLVCEGMTGTFYEVNHEGALVWRYVNPVTGLGIVAQGEPLPRSTPGGSNQVFSIRRYPPSYPGLAGKDLTPRGTVERRLEPGG